MEKPHRQPKKRRLPDLIEPAELSRRLERAVREAGYEIHREAIDAIHEAVPGTPFDRSDMSLLMNLGRSRKEPRLGRVLTICFVLGLDPKIVFQELYDEKGEAITRRSHPGKFRRGFRKFPVRESHPTTESDGRTSA